jgi:plasmid maintenance system killer protein
MLKLVSTCNTIGVCYHNDKELQMQRNRKIFQLNFSKKLPQQIHKVALRKLELLEYSTTLEDLKVPPSNRLELLINGGYVFNGK